MRITAAIIATVFGIIGMANTVAWVAETNTAAAIALVVAALVAIAYTGIRTVA